MRWRWWTSKEQNGLDPDASTETKSLPISELIDDALVHHQNGDLQKAEAIYQAVLQEHPEQPDALHLLGLIAHQVGKNEDAAVLIQKAIEINPNVPEYHSNCGEVFRALQNYPSATNCYQNALALRPDFVEAYNNLGNVLQKLGQREEAIVSYEKAISLKPDFVEAHNNLGNVLQELGQHEKAIVNYKKAISLKPDFIEAYNNLGITLKKLGFFQEASTQYEKMLTLQPNHPEAHNNFGNVLKELGRHKEAIASYETALALKPDFAEAHNNLAVALQETGGFSNAIEHYKQAISLKPDYSEAICNLATANPKIEQAKNIEGYLENSSLSEQDAGQLHFALGTIFDKNDIHEKAFTHFHTANKLKRNSFEYDSNAHTNYINKIIDIYSEKYFQDNKIIGDESKLPLFIVGMLRSGTTLIEQIFASHPQIQGAGEIPYLLRTEENISRKFSKLSPFPASPYPECMNMITASIANQAALEYIQQTQSHQDNIENNIEYITDKLPGNFLRIGLIKILFPNAQIIHCKRNALDICLSSYFNNFTITKGNEYTCDLHELGQYYVDYERLMSHWNSIFSSQIFEINYEDLVTNQETVSRQLINHLELEWDKRCLDFYRNDRVVRTASNIQVRQPMYVHSIGRWKNYEKYLGPLISVLPNDIHHNY